MTNAEAGGVIPAGFFFRWLFFRTDRAALTDRGRGGPQRRELYFMSLESEQLEDLKEIEADQGANSLTWQGSEYPCSVGPVSEGAVVEFGGAEVQIDCVLVLRANLFAVYQPRKQSRIEFAGKSLMVASADTNETRAILSLTCLKVGKGV